MQTSYFNRIFEIQYPVSIALFSPKQYKGKQYLHLMPHYTLLQDYKNNNIDEDRYRYLFSTEILKKLNPHTVVKELNSFYNTEDWTLLCYEKPKDFCHRHIVRDWLNSYDYTIKELR